MLQAQTHLDEIARSVGLNIGAYGSSRVGLAIPHSDLDVCVARTIPVHPTAEEYRTAARNALTVTQKAALMHALANSPLLTEVQLIPARVPVVKCLFSPRNLAVDITLSTTGMYTTHFLETQLAKPEFVLARPLIVAMKCLLRSWDLNDAAKGGIGGFLASIMTLWYLTEVGRSSEPQVKRLLTNEPGHLASLLIGLLSFYGSEFKYRTTVVNVEELTAVQRRSKDKLHFVHPLTSHNAASGVQKFGTKIRPLFQEAARELRESPEELLGVLKAMHDERNSA